MRYAKIVEQYGLPCVEICDGETPFPEGSVWPVTLELPGYDMIIDLGILREKTLEEKQAYIDAKAAYEAAQEEAWQQAKSPALKALENIYIAFLTNMWTPALVDLGLIPPDKTITVNNTDEPTNMYLLMQMRTINYTKYDQMASEFLRLKIAITGNGGIMSKVISHT